MKAEIRIPGTLCLIPENQTEAYALMKWHGESKIGIDDIERMETKWYRGSAIKIIPLAVDELCLPDN